MVQSDEDKLIDQIIERDLDAAIQKGKALDLRPAAQSVRYDEKSGRVVVDLDNGCIFAFPANRAQGLEDATPEDLSRIEIWGAGQDLFWPRLDVDLSVQGLLAGLFGTKAYMDKQRAAKAGATKSARKSTAARQNGAKGGRPRKSA